MQQRLHLLVYYQIATTILVALAWLMSGDLNSVYSSILGGIAWTLPTFCSMKWTFKNTSLPKSKATGFSFLKNFYFGEMIRLFLSIILIILFIKLCPFIKIQAFFSGYLAAIFAVFFGPLLLCFKKSDNA
jgi:F0F1-type ATP synthase assembly protein I